MAGSANVLVALGIVLLVVGGVGLVYRQLQVQQSGDSGEGAFVTVDFSGGDDGGDAGRPRTIRFGGLVVGAIGGVVALTGGLVE